MAAAHLPAGHEPDRHDRRCLEKPRGRLVIAADWPVPGANPVWQNTAVTPGPAAENCAPAAAAMHRPVTQPQLQPAVSLIEKPLIARLQEADVIRTLGGILATGGTPDVTRLGWPALRAGFPLMTFLNAMREMRTALTRHAAKDSAPVIAVIGAGNGQDRSIAALNIALAAARDGANVLMIDADHRAHALSDKVSGLKVSSLGKEEPSRLGWLNIGAKASRAVKTANGISILPAIKVSDVKGSDARVQMPRQATPSTRRLRRRVPAAATPWWCCTDPRCRGAQPIKDSSTRFTDWSQTCRSNSISTTTWKTSSRRLARPNASWSVL